MSSPSADSRLTDLCSRAVESAVAHFYADKLEAGAVSMSVAKLPSRSELESDAGDFHGDQLFYPASTCKLFFLAYAGTLLDGGQLKLTPEVERAFTDMIVASDNDATSAVVDLITGTTSGPELPKDELKEWFDKRLVPTKWFESRGYRGVFVPQKTYYSGPYGREQQGRGEKGEFGNKLSANAATQLLSEIMGDKIASAKSCAWMRAKLARVNPAEQKSADSQATNFIGGILPSKAKLWSKAGWTSTTRHDVACVEFANGQMWVISIFTQGKEVAANPAIVPWIAKQFFTLAGVMPTQKS